MTRKKQSLALLPVLAARRAARVQVRLARVKNGAVVGRVRTATLHVSVARRKRNGRAGYTHDARIVVGELASAHTLSLNAVRALSKGASVPCWFRGHEHALTRV